MNPTLKATRLANASVASSSTRLSSHSAGRVKSRRKANRPAEAEAFLDLRSPKDAPPLVALVCPDHRQGVEVVERRRRRQGPFQGGGAFAPGIGRGLAAADGRFEQHDQED